MKGIIIYKSKYGATEKYAKWISEKTGFEMEKIDKVSVDKLMDHDVIIFGGGVYASGIAGLSFLKKNIAKLSGKKIAVFCVGASPFDQKAFDACVEHNFKDEIKGVPCFYMRGAFDLKNMSFGDRTLCKMLRKAVAKKDPKDYEPWEQGLMEVGDNDSCDWTDISYIDPVLKFIEG